MRGRPAGRNYGDHPIHAATVRQRGDERSRFPLWDISNRWQGLLRCFGFQPLWLRLRTRAGPLLGGRPSLPPRGAAEGSDGKPGRWRQADLGHRVRLDIGSWPFVLRVARRPTTACLNPTAPKAIWVRCSLTSLFFLEPLSQGSLDLRTSRAARSVCRSDPSFRPAHRPHWWPSRL